MVVIIYNNVIIWEKYHNKTNISYSPGGDVKKKKKEGWNLVIHHWLWQ